MVGSHCTRAWSKTQALVARSSGESELYGAVRATCEALGTQTLFNDFGMSMASEVHVDASVAKSICKRKGLDNIRHLDVANLWLQQQQVREKAPLAKIHGKVNMADLMTKHLPFNEIQEHLTRLDLYFQEGRTQMAAQLYGVGISLGGDGGRLRGIANPCNDGMMGREHGINGCNGDVMRISKRHDGTNHMTAFAGKGQECKVDRQDRWVSRGGNKSWVREHRKLRTSLCSPMGIPRWPGNPAQELSGVRVTEGTLVTCERKEVKPAAPWRGGAGHDVAAEN